MSSNCLKDEVPVDYVSPSLEQTAAICEFIRSKISQSKPLIGIVLGSGFGKFAHCIENAEILRYSEIPGFPISSVPGHAGAWVFGTLNGKPVICMQGRVHPYEGYSYATCAMPIRVMSLLGVQLLMLTNAAGGLNSNFKIGDFMIINDHIFMPGFACQSPLRGPNEDRFGIRFPSMTSIYDLDLRHKAEAIALEYDHQNLIHQGVYAQVGGPQFESPAELRLLKAVGADAVGMSTCHEAITAKHCGMKVFGMSLISNICVTNIDTTAVTNHEEVLETGRQRTELASKLLAGLVGKIDIS